jgi:hypothetical protein
LFWVDILQFLGEFESAKTLCKPEWILSWRKWNRIPSSRAILYE